MCQVCGATLSLFDAGVPLKAAVAGVSVGLVTENESEGVGSHNENANIGRWVLLTDINGSEDHYGDMDFKVRIT